MRSWRGDRLVRAAWIWRGPHHYQECSVRQGRWPAASIMEQRPGDEKTARPWSVSKGRGHEHESAHRVTAPGASSRRRPGTNRRGHLKSKYRWWVEGSKALPTDQWIALGRRIPGPSGSRADFHRLLQRGEPPHPFDHPVRIRDGWGRHTQLNVPQAIAAADHVNKIACPRPGHRLRRSAAA